jgi:hypothetical protein
MYTSSVINQICASFESQIRKIEAGTEASYNAELETIKTELYANVKKLRFLHPLMMPIIMPDESQFDEVTAGRLLDAMKKQANNKKVLDVVYTGACASRVIQRYRVPIPKYINFAEKPHVLIEPYKDDGWERFAVNMMTQIILGCLMSLPKGKVRINFVNPSLSDKAKAFTQNLIPNLCRISIDKSEVENLIESLQNRIKRVLKGEDFDESEPLYEIVILLDYPYMFDGFSDKMRVLVEQGKQAGIHFIVLNDLRKSFIQATSFDVLSLKNAYFQEFGAFNNPKKEDFNNSLFTTYEIREQPALFQACLDYLGADMETEDDIQQNDAQDHGYTFAKNGLNVTIGKPIDKKTMEFCLGQDGHVHSFIIGQTGSGKSVLLHDIILEAIRKYSPEDLQLYLLDCKLGGVEFNRYKGVKHARALLVDNSDIQVILEILRDLRDQMQDRGKLLREAGVQKIDDYNQSHSDNRMSRIWVVIDECHVLFEQHATSERKARAEMIDIINKVATEGRSQGVHLIMATQTLANSDIPTAILNNITDRYILTCASIDAEKMWSNSSKLIGNLGVGDVYYHNTTGRFPDTLFHAFYLSKEDAEVQISAAVAKAEGHQSNGQFYFNGSLVFRFNEKVIETIGKIRKENLKACAGRSISLKQEPMLITLKQDMSENVLLTGIDDQGQSMRTAMDLLVSLIACNKKNGLNYKFYVFDYKDDEDGEYQNVLEQLEDAGVISIAKKREQGILLKQFVENINKSVIEPSILIILGQQRFRELKMDVELEARQESFQNGINIFGPMNFTQPEEMRDPAVKTYKDALSYILDNGPDFHVHTILQVDKLNNLLFQENIFYKFVIKKFRHLIMLRSDQRTASTLGLPEEIKIETLNSEPERLRAIYYADGDDGWTLFSPFAMPDKDFLSSITK